MKIQKSIDTNDPQTLLLKTLLSLPKLHRQEILLFNILGSLPHRLTIMCCKNTYIQIQKAYALIQNTVQTFLFTTGKHNDLVLNTLIRTSFSSSIAPQNEIQWVKIPVVKYFRLLHTNRLPCNSNVGHLLLCIIINQRNSNILQRQNNFLFC